MRFRSLFITLGLLALLALPTRAQRPPNIVVFLVDDMGWQDTSVPFHTAITALNRKYHTPNMERLAARGMKFTQAYAATVCSPSRVSLMTGLNAARHRVTNWTLRKDTSTDGKHPTLTPPEWNVNGLSPVAGVPRTVHATPLPAILQSNGYHTIHVGKAHFGALGTPGENPLNLGFDVNVAGHAAGAPGSYLGQYNFSAAWRKGERVWDTPGLEKYHGQDIFLTEALTREANAAVNQAIAQKKPFYLYLSHYAVHTPIEKDDRYFAKYKAAGLTDVEAMFAALVEGMDKSLGDVMDNLEKQGVADNTIILFLADNGSLSAHGRGGELNTHNAPLKSGKGSAYEGGTRIPMIVSWPQNTKANSICTTPVIIEDVFPTVLEWAGVKNAKLVQQPIDGQSFVPLLQGKAARKTDRAFVWHYPHIWGPKGLGIELYSAIRVNDWKLIYFHAEGRRELYNLAKDIGEQHDLAQQNPKMAARLSQHLRKYFVAVKAQMPLEKSTNQLVPLP